MPALPFLVQPIGATVTEALQAAAAIGGHLRRLQTPERCARLAALGAEGVAQAAERAAAAAAGEPEAGSLLRQAKADLHLACAAADLAGLWDLAAVTGALSRFADAAVASALEAASTRVLQAPPPPGLFVLAMGKLGAGELNYSSDVDLTVFYDAERMGADAKRRAARLTQALAALLEERTAEGYVFRVDLRLRPDPASTPAAVNIAFAEVYYQSLGQNWERAAFIKARPIAGDLQAATAFLSGLESFRWRRTLDFAAIADIRSIKRQLSGPADEEALRTGVFDLKRDRGGIRDIELFAQTHQLILGGRHPALRAPATLDALAALAEREVVSSAEAEVLAHSYCAYRALEHRLQMLEDEQTHALPRGEKDRARLAALCGRADFAALARDAAELRRAVIAVDATLFSDRESLADASGRLSFTGVEDDPATLETLRRLGFAAPEKVTEAIRGWHHGRVRATRSQRARELLTELTPALLRAMADTGSPDAAFAAFALFFTTLPAGVQTLSLFANHPPLLTVLAEAFAAAPRLARQLGGRPAALDTLLEARVLPALHAEAQAAHLRQRMRGGGDYERKLDEARRFHRDESFRISLHLLLGRMDGPAAGAAFTALADACIGALFEAAAQDCVGRAQLPQGRVALLGLGKLGGGELAAGSDLDLMLLYDSDEEKPERATRFAQALIAALSAPTAEGPLYAIDMQLRPSGGKGPIAVRLSRFARYYAEEAWTWELLALTRARVVAGDAALGDEALAAAQGALARPRDLALQRRDVAAMRARMTQERPARGPWDLKLAPGGLVDVEFAVQARMLEAAQSGADAVRANTGEAALRLGALGALRPEEAQTLHAAWRRLSTLSQLIRVATEEPLRPQEAAPKLRALLASRLDAASFEELEAELFAAMRTVRALLETLLAPP